VQQVGGVQAGQPPGPAASSARAFPLPPAATLRRFRGRAAVAAVAAVLSVLQELLPGTLPAVRVARDPHHQGSQGEH